VTAFPTNQDLDPGRLRTVFGIFPTGVVAVAARVDGRLTGLAASSFTSVSLNPPLVLISVANTSRTWPDLRRAAHLGVTVLADHHGGVARQLAGPADSRFEGIRVTTSEDGAVTLADGLAQFDTTIYREVEAGDHTVVLLLLHAAENSDHSLPLVFHRSSFGLLRQAGQPAGSGPHPSVPPLPMPLPNVRGVTKAGSRISTPERQRPQLLPTRRHSHHPLSRMGQLPWAHSQTRSRPAAPIPAMANRRRCAHWPCLAVQLAVALPAVRAPWS
jgi:flavin reductase (DIM6/NTAB) family NADH-FMN oxidoreductase RutF